MDDRTKTERPEPWPGPITRPGEAPLTADTPPRRRRKGWLVVLLGLVAIAGVGWWVYNRPHTQTTRPSRGGQPPVTVTAVQTGDINVTVNALGTVASLATVTVRSQISGYITRIVFKEGDLVKQGDLLVEIDSRTYQLALAQAEGNLKRDQALLQAAQLDMAKLNIAYCHIVAPVSGRVGLRQVDQGNYVTANDANGLVVITQLTPISVLFTTAEDNLPPILKRVQSGAVLPVTAYNRSGADKLATGQLLTFDNQIDTSTG